MAMIRLMKICLIAALFAMIPVRYAAGGDYRWPLKITPKLSSQFGDYRLGHWHAGIDITTRGRPGYRVYAIDDGYIFRVKASFWGYGNALYLKLKDGRFAVYGHLARFSHQLDNYILREQRKSKRYYQDLFFEPDQFPVKKGDYIALSGQSGSGAPHLHLEIRDNNNLPINPLAGFYDFADDSPPEIEYLVLKRFRNVGQGNYHEFEFLKIDGKRPFYSIDDTIAVYDQTVISIAGYDPENSYNYGLFSASMLLNGGEIFNFKNLKMDYSTGYQIDYVRDLPLKLLVESSKGLAADNDKNVFCRLYIQPDDIQLFYGDFSYPAGIIFADSLNDSLHELKILISDVNNNTSEVRLYLKKAILPKPNIDEMILLNDTLLIKSEDINEQGSIQLERRPNKISPYEPIPVSSELFKREALCAVENTDSDYRLRLTDEKQAISPWIEFNLNTGGEFVNAYADYLEVVLSGDESIMANDIPLENFYNLPLPGGFNKATVPVPVENGYFRISLNSMPSEYGYYRLNSGGMVFSPDSSIKIEIKENHLYDPTIIKISMPKRVSKGYEFDIYPDVLLFKNAVDIKVDKDRLNISPVKSSLYYYWPSKNRWIYIGNNSAGLLKGESGGGGRFGILEDIKGPSIYSVRPKHNSSISDRTPYLSCRVVDDLSGIKEEVQLEMSIDGVWVPAYYDIDSKEFGYQVKNPLKKSTHALRIRAVDNQGNESISVSRFTIR